MPLGISANQGDATAIATTDAAAAATAHRYAAFGEKHNNGVRKRKTIPSSDRYFLYVVFAVIVYLLVIYKSLQFAGPPREKQRSVLDSSRFDNADAAATAEIDVDVDIDGPSAYAKTYANAFSKAYPNAGNFGVHPRGVVNGENNIENNENDAQQQKHPPGNSTATNAIERLEMRRKNTLDKNYINNYKREKVVRTKVVRNKIKKTERTVVKPRLKIQEQPKKTFVPVKVLQVAPDKLRLPKPIINVGFPKAGTSTIFSFFHCNGLKAQHWFCCEPQDHPTKTEHQKLMSYCMLKNMISNQPLFQGCGDYDVYSEINGPRRCQDNNYRLMLDDGTVLSYAESTNPSKDRIFFPQHHQLDKIDDQYPSATLILNHRNTKEWIASVKKWDIGLKYQILNEFYRQNSTRFLFDDMEKEQQKKLDEWYKHYASNHNISAVDHVKSNSSNVEKRKTPSRKKPVIPFFDRQNIHKYLEIVYNYHIEHIKDWVTRHPSHALVEVDITHEGAGKILAEAFGLNEECWGHFNKNKQGSNTIRRKRVPGKTMVSGEASGERGDVVTKQLETPDQNVERVMNEQTTTK